MAVKVHLAHEILIEEDRATSIVTFANSQWHVDDEGCLHVYSTGPVAAFPKGAWIAAHVTDEPARGDGNTVVARAGSRGTSGAARQAARAR